MSKLDLNALNDLPKVDRVLALAETNAELEKLSAEERVALPATDDELRLARQARNLVRAHHCPDAAALVDRLAATNVAYASAMRAQLACDPRGASSP